MVRFNQWEHDYIRDFPVERRLEQFFILFDLGHALHEEKIERMHEEHLHCLIEIQKALKTCE